MKHGAELAGLGTINRNYLLTNKKYGNLLWFSAILTDAKLEPDKPVTYKMCDSCNRCVSACPSEALNNSKLFMAKECSRSCWKQLDRRPQLVCHLCHKICPYGLGV